jgi:hypothetical protein
LSQAWSMDSGRRGSIGESMRQIAIFIGVAAVVGVMSSGLLGSGDPSAGSPGFVDRPPARGTDRAHRVEVQEAARLDVRARLEALRLPPSATRIEKAPRGKGSELLAPFIEPETPNLIDRPAFWVGPGDPNEVLAWIGRHPPRGSTLKVESSSGDHLVTTSWSIGFEWPPIDGLVSERALLVTAVATATHETTLRVDAQGVWIVPRPLSERVPAAPGLLEVSVGRAGSPGRRLSIDNARLVRRIVASINRLPIAQPGVTSCPLESLHPVIVSLVFRAARRAPALAEAKQEMPVGTCDPMQLSIGGQHEPPLTDSRRVMRQLRALIRKAHRPGVRSRT